MTHVEAHLMGWSGMLARNTLFNSLGRLASMIVSLALTPVVLRTLGSDRFGVWSLLLAVGGYFFLVDFGFFAAFTKYVAEYHARKQPFRISEVVSTGIALYSGILLVSVVTLLLGASNVLRLLNIPSQLHAETLNSMYIVVLSLGLLNLFSPFQGSLFGVQRMDLSCLVLVVSVGVNASGTLFVLRAGYGLIGLSFVYLSSVLVVAAGSAVLAHLVIRGLQVRPRHVRRETFRSLFTYGWKVQIANLAAMVNFAADRVLIGAFLTVSYVTVYELGFRVAFLIILASQLLVSAMVPTVSSLDATNDAASLRRLYRYASKYHVLVILPASVFVATCAPTILEAWLGQQHPDSALVIRALIVGYVAKTLTDVPVQFVRGMGRPELEMRYSINRAVLNLLLGIVFIQYFGFYGILIATPLALVISAVYFFYNLHKKWSIFVPELLGHVFALPFVWSFAAGLAAVVVQWSLAGKISLPVGWASSLTLVAALISFCAVFGVGLVVCGYIRKAELDKFMAYMWSKPTVHRSTLDEE